MTKILFTTGTFRDRYREQIESAKEKGALKPIATDYEVVVDSGIPFIVRITTNLVRKEKAKKKAATDFDPFLPYESDLFVTDISPTHLCLLNKYNVIEEHLLIVTRAFVQQETPLNFDDFLALWAVLKEVDGLAFYNSGTAAGASVTHKHLQLVPKALAPSVREIPIEVGLQNWDKSAEIGQISLFPYRHSYSKLAIPWQNSLMEAAKMTLSIYQQLLHQLNLQPGAPYNLLMTREWMLMIPRSQPTYQHIAINSLGFAGAMLVKNQEQLQFVKTHTPLKILAEVGVSK